MYKYLTQDMSKGFISLLTGRVFELIALGLLNLFLPIYLLEKFNLNIVYVFWFYLAGYLLYALILPLGMQYINIIGLNNAFRTSLFFYTGYLIAIFFIGKNLMVMVSLATILVVFARLFFWLPYHVDLAEYTCKKERGKELSLLWIIKILTSVVMPVISGYVIYKYGYSYVFLVGVIIYMSAFIPYLAIPETNEKYTWGVRETFKRFFYKKNRSLVLANMANGAENVVGVIIWPIFIWDILQGNYFEVGLLSSLIVLVTVILQLTAGKYTDSISKRKLLKLGSLTYAVGWLAKIFVLTASQIFLVGTYHSFTAIFKDTPFEALNYEILADKGHYVDEYTAIKEMAVNIGKVLILVFAIVVAINFGLNWTFALAALASIFVNVL